MKIFKNTSLPKNRWLPFALLMIFGTFSSSQAGIVARWSFDESGGTVAQDSVGSNNGTLSPAGSAFVSGGISGNAISVNQALNGFVNMGNVFGFTNQPFSVVAWLKTAAGYSIDDSHILGKHSAFTQNGFWLIVNRAGGGGLPGRAIFGEGAVASSVMSTTTVNDGSWHQIVATFNPGQTLTIYVDGAPAESTAAASPSLIPNIAPFLIGAATFGGTPQGRLTGLVDEVQIYNHVLSAEDVAFLFLNPTGIATSCSDLLAATQAQLAAANAQIASLQSELATAQAEIAAMIQPIDALTEHFQTLFGNPNFQIPGADPAAQIFNLVNGIESLNHGQQQALYFNLGGRKKHK